MERTGIEPGDLRLAKPVTAYVSQCGEVTNDSERGMGRGMVS
jgi:hypothetical protein